MPRFAWKPVVNTRAASRCIQLAKRRSTLDVQIKGPVHQSGAGAATSVTLDRRAGRLLDLRMLGQPQVVVGSKHYLGFAVNDYLWAGLGFDRDEIGVNSERFRHLRLAIGLSFIEKVQFPLPFRGRVWLILRR